MEIFVPEYTNTFNETSTIAVKLYAKADPILPDSFRDRLQISLLMHAPKFA